MKKISNKHFILDTTAKPNVKGRIKGHFYSIMASVYKLRMSTINIKPSDKDYNVSICAIFKNEAAYLREWIEFHRIIGIEHFYLYNNNSEDDYMSVIAPYIEDGIVTLTQWTKNQAQMECYKDCISKYSCKTKWLGFIDIDEFVVPKSTNNIYDFLKKFEKNRGAIKIYWRMFGTSGLIDRDTNSLVTETLTVCWPKHYSVGKCFYNTGFTFDGDSPKNNILHHMLWTKYNGKNVPPVNAFNRVCLGPVDKVNSDEHPIQINHYFTKSYEEYAKKRAKGDVYFKINPHDEEYFYLHEMENTSVDYSAYKYLTKLKLAMKDSKNE